ncbi:MAG: hypothetical protein IJ295_01560, partial [Clostridia bacterium]|nr:hypothetical protein [Clostridia bacterium]
MAENNQLNVSELQGIPSYIPIFISAENLYKDDYTNPMIQTYKKNFIFVCYGGTGDYNQKELEFSYGQTFTVFNAQQNNYNIIFNKAWCQFVCWKMNGDYYNVGKAYKVGISDELKGDQFIFDASGSDCWVNYPVQFYIYNGKNNEAYEPSAFYDNKGNKYSISKLLTYSNNLGQIYLPGLDHKFTGTDGSVYQFIGWSINQTIPSTFNSLLWNNTNIEYRILPNRTRNTVLNSGYLTRDGESDV